MTSQTFEWKGGETDFSCEFEQDKLVTVIFLLKPEGASHMNKTSKRALVLFTVFLLLGGLVMICLCHYRMNVKQYPQEVVTIETEIQDIHFLDANNEALLTVLKEGGKD